MPQCGFTLEFIAIKGQSSLDKLTSINPLRCIGNTSEFLNVYYKA